MAQQPKAIWLKSWNKASKSLHKFNLLLMLIWLAFSTIVDCRCPNNIRIKMQSINRSFLCLQRKNFMFVAVEERKLNY